MSQFLAPQIVFLKSGTDTSQGKGQLLSNMSACQAVGEILRTTLGPQGMDKLIHDDRGNSVTISNDGATIIKLLNIIHPAARTLVDIAKAQDDEVGDGTTSVTVLACELLKMARDFVEEGMHPRIIIKAYRTASDLAIQRIKQLAIDIRGSNPQEHREMLIKCAATALNSKLISHHKEFFSAMVTDAVLSLDADLDISMVGMKKVAGGSVRDSILVSGVAFKKTFSYAGFEQQPKKFENPRILLLNIELELKAEKENAEVRVKSTKDYQDIVDAEWKIIYDKLDKIVATGAKVVLSRLAIGDLATQYFADRDIFCAGRVPDDDMLRVARAVGGAVQTSVNNIPDAAVGSCAVFEERTFGNDRFNLFTGCPQAKTATIIIRGGSEQFMEETERSLHDSIMIVRRAIKFPTAVAGGGAIEMELSKYIREHATQVHGKQQLVIQAFAKALEVIPRTLCDNAGFDSTDVMNKLRAKHASAASATCWYGVDIDTGDICDTWESFVWEPALVRLNAISAATEACCLVLSVDETITNPQHQAAAQGAIGTDSHGHSHGTGGQGMAGMVGGRQGVQKFKGAHL